MNNRVMKKYLKNNYKLWQAGYYAPNVENVIFRLQGKILKLQFNMPSNNEVLLDFGCGQGASTNYFDSLGYDVYGIDISKKDIEVAKERYPNLANRFKICEPEVFRKRISSFTDNKKIAIIVCQQSLYYFNKRDFFVVLKKFNESLRPKGLLYASMMSEKHTFFKLSKKTKEDSWLRKFSSKKKAFVVKNYFNFCVKNKLDLKKKFSIFNTIYMGSYHLELIPNDTNNHHYTILCQKK